MKNILALIWILVLCLSLLFYSMADQGQVEEHLPPQPEETTCETEDPGETAPRLYFLNGQPVLQAIWTQLAEEFARQTGIDVTIVSSEEKLRGQEPVIFSASTAQELERWPCLDLADTVAYANLASESFALTQGEKVCGIASEAEPFGILCNAALLAQAGYTDEDVDSFADLKTVAGLITANQEKLGFGAFAQPDEGGHYAAMLAAVPDDPRQLWDLYSTNLAPGTLNEGKAVFQLGTLTDMERLSAAGGLQLQMLPLYTGAPDEENRGLYCFGKHYWCIRADASQEEISAALAFLNFVISPRLDGTVPVDDLGILAPYRQAIHANNSVGERLRRDIALGKELLVCGAEEPAAEDFVMALEQYTANPTQENWAMVEYLRRN